MLKSNNIKKGFTIIEVIIVLVIAAIIMVMVFLVVPQLQQSQRNAKRQNTARSLLTAMAQNYANGLTAGTGVATATALNNGGTGTFIEGLYNQLGSGDITKDPQSASIYNIDKVYVGAGTPATPSKTQGSITIYTNATCTGGAVAQGTQNVVAIAIEPFSNAYFCVAN